MAMVKMTFSLSAETVALLNDAAQRLSKPKSQVVREAIRDFHANVDRLSEAERIRMIATLDRLVSTPPSRSASDMDREIEEIRASRRAGGRRSRVE